MHNRRSSVRHLQVAAPRRADVNRRLLAIMLVTVLVAGGLTYRLVQLQILAPERYVAQGEAQRTREIALPGPRGEILDRNGNRLAISIPQHTFFVDPAFVADPGAAAEALAPVLGQESALLYEKFTADSRFVYLARQVSDDVAHQVLTLNIPGVYSLQEPTRFNPAGDGLAGSFLGRVGVDSQPLSGLEYAYDSVLAGAAGKMVVEKSPAGQTMPMGPRELVPASPGSDLVITIDRALQYEVEGLLMAQVEAMVAKGGIAVVTETRTGDILAMASVSRDAEQDVILSPDNLASTWAFEPGSVMKAVTFSAVLDSGIANASSVKTVPDTFQLYDRVFSDTSYHAPTDWSVRDIVRQSSNVGSIMWATELGASRFDPYLRSFGLTKPVLGLPGETNGILADLDDWDGTTIGAVALGQGISVSALQIIQAFNVIANDGIMVPLRLVQGTQTPEGDYSALSAGPSREVISADTAGQMRSILRDVVDSGTGTAAAVDGYGVAGKTGTARKPLPTGGYQDAAGNYRYVSSFIGFLPAEDPEISILVALDEPAASFYASVVAAPVFADIAHYSLRHFNIPPSAELLEAAPITDAELEALGDVDAEGEAPVAVESVLDDSEFDLTEQGEALDSDNPQDPALEPTELESTQLESTEPEAAALDPANAEPVDGESVASLEPTSEEVTEPAAQDVTTVDDTTVEQNELLTPVEVVAVEEVADG